MRIFLTLAVLCAFAASLVTVSVAWMVLGTPGQVSIDPQTLASTLTRNQWLGLGAGLILLAMVLAVGMAASVHAASEPGIGVRAAFGKIRANSMQIFWLQFVVYALAARFSPWAALLLWITVGLTVPVALCEDLGLSDAMDRAWELSRGARGRILALELLLPLLPLAALIGLGALEGPVGPLDGANSWLRVGVAEAGAVVILLLAQFVFAALTRLYQALAAEPALHVRAASNVNS